MALLTIGIPVYNEEKYLAKTIESALNQSFTDFRLIISDNCSQDKSYVIAKEYSERDSRIEVIRHPKKISIVDNGKCSLDASDTKYFVWLGGHDIFLKEYLEKAIEVLENNPDIVMAYPKTLSIDKDDVVMGTFDSNIDTIGLSRREKLFKVARELFRCTSVHGVFRTAILKKLPFENIIGGDHLFLFMATLYGDIHMMEIEGIKWRQVRVETYDEACKRWRMAGMEDSIAPLTLLILKHIEHIWRYRDMSSKEKIAVSLGTTKILFKMFFVDFWRNKYPCFNYFHKSLKRLCGCS